MRLDRLDTDIAFLRRSRKELEELLARPAIADARPCPGCDLPCPHVGSPTCGCGCSPDCPDAPLRLTSDPGEFPIEAGIMPLVFWFYATGITPYWSCGGHADDAGNLIRLPRLWFYSRSVIYPRLIYQYISHLRSAGKLTTPWRVALTFSDNDNADTGFSVEPAVPVDKNLDLEGLRRDVHVIAEDLNAEVRARARSLLRLIAQPATTVP